MRVKFARRQKYNAHPTVYKGRKYDSKAEANYAMELDKRIGSGDVYCWLRQIPFDLGDDNRYRADFVVIESDGTIYAVDVKGVETPSFKKIKRLWEKYGKIPLRIIKGGKLSYEL